MNGKEQLGWHFMSTFGSKNVKYTALPKIVFNRKWFICCLEN